MTNQEINEAVAKQLGWKHEFSEAKGEWRWIAPSDGMSWLACDEYASSYDNAHEILNHIAANRPAMSAAFLNALRDVLAPWMPKNKAGSPIISDFDLLMASPKEICLAFLKVKGVKV